MTTISQAARDAGEQLPWGHHVYPEVVARIIQDAIDAEKTSETASLRQQLEEAKSGRDALLIAKSDEIKRAIEANDQHMLLRTIDERDTALARVAELEAQCAEKDEALNHALRMVRKKTLLVDLGPRGNGRHVEWLEDVMEHALSSTAGASLLAHVKELEQDKARLDWIEMTQNQIVFRFIVGKCWMNTKRGLGERWESLREAIDAAMAKDQEQNAGGER